MSQAVDKRMLTQIGILVATCDHLAQEASGASSELGPERVADLSECAARGAELAKRLYGHDSGYAQSIARVASTTSFAMMHSNHWTQVAELGGILRGIKSDLESGMLADVRQLLRAEIFSDFLEMAAHLLEEGYKDPAAVVLGAVLEDSLRKLAESRGLATNSPAGKALTIDPLNVALAKDGAYNALVQKQITSWANLRNDAAHGRFVAYDEGQVKHMMQFLEKFCADHLA